MKKSPKKRQKCRISPENAKLLKLINEYLEATGRGPTAWGLAAVNDARFVEKLAAGHKFREKAIIRAKSALAAGWSKIAKLAPIGAFAGPWDSIAAPPG